MHEFKIDNNFPKELVPFLNEQLAYCDSNLKSWDLTEIDKGILKYTIEKGTPQQNLEQKISFIVERVLGKGNLAPHKEISRIEISKESIFVEGLEENLIALDWVKNLGEGIFTLQGPLAKLSRIFDDLFFQLSLEMNARESTFPSLLSKDFLQIIDYFSSFPQYTTYVSHLKPDLETINNFINQQQNNKSNIKISDTDFADFSMILSPTVCYHAYDYLKNTKLDEDNLLLTAKCNCYRWESKNMVHLKRLWEFQMRELIFVGNPNFVLRKRQESLDRTLEICKLLGINAWVETANDSFFVSENSSKKRNYQKGMGMKWELRIPYNTQNDSVAAASFNFMQKTFGESCNIRLSDDSLAFTGCAGWGIERWIYSFLAQKGLEIDKWPEYIKNEMR